MARLGDLFLHIRNGANIKQGLDNTGYPITRIETISNRTVDRNKMGYAGITDLEKYSDFVMQDGDILMSHINSETHLGKTALYEKEGDEIIIHGMNLLSLRPNKDLIISKYAFYYLSSQSFLRQIPNITKKSVNQASFTVSALKELVFPLTSIEEQKKITVDLDKVNGLISIRKQQLSKLDELVKSRFIELFGEPITNSKCLPTNNLGKVLLLKAGDFTVASDIAAEPTTENIYPCYGGNGIRGYVAEYNQEGSYSLIGRQGALSGNVQYATGKFKNTEHALLVTPLIEMNSIWLNHLLINLDLQRYQTGAAQPGLSVKNLQEIPIIEVPKEDQYQFATFVEQTDKSKFEIQQSLDKLETLKKALMQKYFG
jgi:type I restriction enzyme S subunit